MTHPTEYFSNPRPESGRGRHTQESGDAGLSSNLEHKFSDEYNESAFPVAEKGSFVMPIPKGELDVFEYSRKAEKIWSHPSVFGHAAHPKAESHSVSVEEVILKPSTQAVVQKNHSPPHENDPEEDIVKILPGTTDIIEPDEEEDNCFMDSKTDSVGNPKKPKGPLLVLGKRRNGNNRGKRAAGKNRILLLLRWMTFMHVSASFADAQLAADQNVTCFTCMDKDKCQKLMTIFGANDTNLYQRELKSSLKTFPPCSGISPPTLKSCVVCNQSSITIKCSKGVGKLEVENSDGAQILNISSVSCDIMKGSAVQQTPGRKSYVLIATSALFVIVVMVLVIHSRCRENRVENSNNEAHNMEMDTAV